MTDRTDSGQALDATTLARYRREGFLTPLRVLEAAEAAGQLAALDALTARRAGRMVPWQNIKAHLLIPALWELVRHPAILDPVEALLGPDLLCLGSSFFDKQPGTPQHVPWHQDATYWGLSAPQAVTAWVALTPSRVENGCMRVWPASHHRALTHADTGDNHAMIPGREEVVVAVEEAEAVDIVLAPGEMSLHDALLVHGSRPNGSTLRRCGFAIRYIPGHLTTSGGLRGSATLVRGRDHGGFDLETAPEAPFDPAAVAQCQRVARQFMRIFMPRMGSGKGGG